MLKPTTNREMDVVLNVGYNLDMLIAFVANESSPLHPSGDTTAWLASLGKALVSLGHKVIVYSSRPCGNFQAGVIFRNTTAFVNSPAYDAVIVVDGWFPGIVDCLAARRVAWITLNLRTDYLGEHMQEFEAVFVATAWETMRLAQRYPELAPRIAAVSHGISEEYFQEVSHEIPPKTEPPVILIPEINANLLNLLGALSSLRTWIPGLEVHILAGRIETETAIGGSILTDATLSQAGVQFLGNCDCSERIKAFRSALMVLCPMGDGLLRGAVEAFAGGAVVIAQDTAAAHSIVGDCGLLLPSDSYGVLQCEGLHEKICEVYLDAHYRNDIARRARSLAFAALQQN